MIVKVCTGNSRSVIIVVWNVDVVTYSKRGTVMILSLSPPLLKLQTSPNGLDGRRMRLGAKEAAVRLTAVAVNVCDDRKPAIGPDMATV